MERFLEIQGPNCREILHCPLPKATHVCLKKQEEKPEGEGVSAPERSRTHHLVFHISTTEMILNRLMLLLTPYQSRTTWVLLASI